MTLFSLTRQLIDIPSVTGNEEMVGAFLFSYLEGLGYRVEKQLVAENRFNVLALTDAKPEIVLSTHMDTVPPFIRSSEDGDNIYGRGSCDAKGIIAAQILAAERLRAEGCNEIGLLFTVDEELGSAGAQVADQHPLAKSCRYLINGEPTDNKLATGTKGSMRFILTTVGRSAHSAYPEAGESAIEKLLDVLEDLRHSDWPSDSFFGDTTCNIGVIQGGTRPNVIPDHARAEVQVRLAKSKDEVESLVERIVAGRAQVEIASAHDPVKLVALGGLEQQVVRFTTDIPYLSNWGKSLLIGPGSILNAHTEHEQISKSELTRAVELYVQIAKELKVKDQHATV